MPNGGSSGDDSWGRSREELVHGEDIVIAANKILCEVRELKKINEKLMKENEILKSKIINYKKVLKDIK